MNHCYKTIWSAVQHAWIAVGEHSKAGGKSKSIATPASGAARPTNRPGAAGVEHYHGDGMGSGDGKRHWGC